MDITNYIIIENSDYLIINKPAGLLTHGDGKTSEVSLADLLIAKYPEIDGVGEAAIRWAGYELVSDSDQSSVDSDDMPNRSGIVHRLDRDTSGVIVVARTQIMYEHLKSQFQKREIFKEYHAFVYGVPKRERGSVNEPIGRENGNSERFAVPPRAKGALREALTYYQVMSEFCVDEMRYAFVRCMPKTGRTHQIRVHMKSIGCPIVMDRGYVGKKLLEHTLGFTRQALHARLLKFRDLENKEVEILAEYPADFRAAIQYL
jgi:23S rRNA pseudouridine1911/1915/1917 synthase